MSPKTELKINYSDEKYNFNISEDYESHLSETEEINDYDEDSSFLLNFTSDYDIYQDSPPLVKKRRLYCPKYISIIGESAIERRFVVLKKIRKSTDSVPETESEDDDDANVWVDNSSTIQQVVEFNDIEKQERELDNFTVVSHKKKPVPPPIPPPPVQRNNNQTNKFSTACNKLDKCKMGKACHFAHSIEQLTPFECKFGAKCKNGLKCTFKHRTESKEQYVNRLGIKFN
jgi:hypothetical protein